MSWSDKGVPFTVSLASQSERIGCCNVVPSLIKRTSNVISIAASRTKNLPEGNLENKLKAPRPLLPSVTIMPLPLPPSLSYAPLAHLTAQDRSLFYSYGLGSSRHVEIPIVHHAFERHARLQPDAIAIEHIADNQTLTYRELDVQANRLARRLRAQGIFPGKRVCILARRSTNLIVGILAVLKSGGQYVPLDAVTITDTTLDYVLGDSTPSAVLVMDEFAHRVRPNIPTLILEHLILEDEFTNADATKPEDTTSPSDGAYVIYTSGTTGVPKGVDVRHRGVTNGAFS